MTAAKIREAGEQEVERVLGMYEWLFAPPGSRPASWDERHAETALRAAMTDEDGVVLLADDGGGPVGFCTAYLEFDSVRFGRRCWVEDMAVDPERRSEGIGKALLDAAKAWARERGATHLELDSGEARVDAHRFYEREGASSRTKCYGWEL